MAAERSENDRRVLLLAPTARDGEASCRLLASAGISCILSETVADLSRAVEEGAAALILPEEVVSTDFSDQLAATLKRQPVWSDLPVIVLSRSGAESPGVDKAIATLGNVSIVERPVRMSTLLSVVRAAIRARERQYQVRNSLEELRSAERAVSAARDTAEAASRAKDQFLAVLSHELRTPLSPVVMTVASMQEAPGISEDLREQLAMVQRNVELETKLIDDLLDVSRVINGKLHLRMEPLSVHDALRDALEVCASDIRAKRLDVLPQLSATTDRVNGDPARLRQVFWNLLKNAIKFSGERGRIMIRTETVPDHASGIARVRISVSDNGIGIPQDVLPHLFNAFHQGDPSVTRQFGGLGLGLAIAKAVVDLHGGTIHAESAGPGKGAKFIVELTTVEAPAAVGLPSPGLPRRDRENRGTRVLLVEDHADTARALSRLLTLSGYVVRSAASVAAALEIAENEQFDLLLSDIGLPDGSGYDLMRQLSHRCGIKGIALTGYGTEADLQRGRAAGFADHLVKPVNLAQLEAAMERVSQLSMEPSMGPLMGAAHAASNGNAVP